MGRKRKKPYTVRRALRPFPLLLLIPNGLLLPRIASGNPEWIEYFYSARVYPVIRDALSWVFSLAPFSVCECLLYALCLLVPVLLTVQIVLAIKRRSAARLISTVLTLLITAGVMINLFYLVWGLNYFRVPLATRMALPVAERSQTELEEAYKLLLRDAKNARAEIIEDKNGVFTLEGGAARTVFPKLIDAYAALADEEPVFSGKVTAAKPVLYSRGLSWMDICGVYVGFTAEANVNADQPALTLPHAAAHEMAHQLGIASEDEAELAAFLACMESSDASIRYSGLMQMVIRCGNALYAADAERYAELAGRMSDGMRRDLAAHRDYWKAFEGPLEEKASQINDSYLKHNEQADGVKSYGAVVDLLLAYFEKSGRL